MLISAGISCADDVVLAGKQHFCGPDQLHGFRTNLSRDIHAELWQEDGPQFVPKGAADWAKGIDERCVGSAADTRVMSAVLAFLGCCRSIASSAQACGNVALQLVARQLPPG